MTDFRTSAVSSGPQNKRRRALTIAAVVVLLLLSTCAALIAFEWPFTQAKITTRLGRATSTSIRIRGFRTKYFPPGCVMEGVEVRESDNSSRAPILTAGRLTILSNYRELLLHQRIEVMHLEDAHLNMRQLQRLHSKSGGERNGSTGTVVEIVVDRAKIEYPRRKQPPLVFNVHQLTFDNVIRGKRIVFHLTVDNPLPPGKVRADGQFDPWKVSDIAETPISGTYEFTDAKLSSLGGIAGTLSSQGSFAGPAKALFVQGTTDTPDYEVKSAGHPLHLHTEFQAVVNCANGDVGLQSVRGQFQKTSFELAGDVREKPNTRSRVASLRVADPGGRIEDWLHLFTSDQVSPMTGPISYQAQMTIRGGPQPFIRRVHLIGDFALTDVAFTKWKTQQGADELSLRAQGQKVPDPKKQILPKITGTLKGHVELIDGVAHFSNLAYSLPGAVAKVNGTYSFIDESIDLHGVLRVDTKFSKTAGAPKSLLTRVTEGLFARGKGEGEVLPVKLTGTYDRPSYGLDK